MTAASEKKKEEYPSCPFPNCIGGQSVKVADERHDELKASFQKLESGQQKMLEIMLNVATLLADVRNIKDDIKENEKAHTEMFTRLRSVETSSLTKSGIVSIIAAMGTLVAIIEVMFKWVIPK